MKYISALAFAAAACAALPTTSYSNQLAYTSTDVHLRAGPARDYPVVAILRAGVAVSLEGCLGDYTWCDVAVGLDRGWVYAGNIVYPYQGVNVPVLTYGPAIGVGIVVFNLGGYWNEYYRGRPWYPHRHYWSHRPHPVPGPGYHRPPPPPPRPGYPPGGGPHPPPGHSRNDGYRPLPPPPGGGPYPPSRQWRGDNRYPSPPPHDPGGTPYPPHGPGPGGPYHR